MNFTKEEKIKLVENCKNIISFIEKEYLPQLRNEVRFTLDVRERTKPLRICLYPNNSVYIARSEEYSFKPVENNPYRYFFSEENADLQMILIKNWKMMKSEILDQIEKDKDDINILNSFTI